MNIKFDKISVLDGATGTNLIKSGMPQGVCPEEWILDHPDVVENLQCDYINAGSDIIYAPTFGANSAVLSRFGHGDKVEDFNRRLIEISKSARQKCGKSVLIAQDLSPTGLFMKPFGDYTFEQIEDIYYEQALAGEKAGADLFVIETTISLAEAKAALSAVRRAAPEKPVFVTVTLEAAGRTISGNGLEACLLTLYCCGACAFGINCSQGPVEMNESIKAITKYSAVIPLIAKPNAGMPQDNGNGEKLYSLTADDFAAAAEDLIKGGVTVIGGCCGTNAEYIQKLRGLADSLKPQRAAHCDISRLVCNEKDVFELPDEITLPDAVNCSIDLADAIMDAEDNGDELIRIFIEKPEDLDYLIESAYLINMPLMLNAANFETLERALKLYIGRVILDPDADLTDEQKSLLISRYNPIIL